MRIHSVVLPLLMLALVAPGPAQAASTTKPTVKPRTSVAMPIRAAAVPELEEAYVQAVLAHAATTAGDWAAAEGHLAALRAHASTLGQAAVSDQVQGAVDRLAPMAARLEASLRARDQIRANEAAFNLVTNFFPALDSLATAGGGGGPTAQIPARSALDALRNLYLQAAKLQAALARGSMDEARAQLGLARMALTEVERTKMAPGWATQVRTIRGRFEDVAGRINDPQAAYARSKDLVFELASTMHMIVSGAGGGGGMPAAPQRPGGDLQDVPPPGQAQERPEQRLERWEEESSSKPNDWRPNQRGGQRN